MNNTTPARQAAEQLAKNDFLRSRPQTSSEDNFRLVAEIITAAYATERQQVREAMQSATSQLQFLVGKIRPICGYDASHTTDQTISQLRDVLEKMG